MFVLFKNLTIVPIMLVIPEGGIFAYQDMESNLHMVPLDTVLRVFLHRDAAEAYKRSCQTSLSMEDYLESK